MKLFHQCWEHGRKSKRAEALRKRDHSSGYDACGLPPWAPVKRIVWIVGWLWNKHVSVRALHEVMTANVGHDLCTRKNFDIELLFDLMTLL